MVKIESYELILKLPYRDKWIYKYLKENTYTSSMYTSLVSLGYHFTLQIYLFIFSVFIVCICAVYNPTVFILISNFCNISELLINEGATKQLYPHGFHLSYFI